MAVWSPSTAARSSSVSGICTEHPLQPVLGFEQLRLRGLFGEVEVAAGARHPVRALLEEAVAAVAVPEVVELERAAGTGGAVGDRVAVEQDLDRPELRAK